MAMNGKLPFDMSFKKVEKFVKNFNVLVCPQGPRFTEYRYFLKNGLFSVILF